MPTVGIRKEELFKHLGKVYSEEEFGDLCFDYGLELDEVSLEEAEDGQKYEVYKIDVPANRYDLLCVEGLCRGLLVFLGKIEIPSYRSIKPSKMQKIFVKPSTKDIRPFVVGAVLRNLKFTPESYNSFIELQDKLHQNICRKRKLVAIGTHDLSTVCGPFVYDCQKPTDICFQALNQSKEHTAAELMEIYNKESHLKPYLPIILGKSLYPVIYDSNHVILSMPPIINGEHSKITLNTKDVLIECTAEDLNKAHVVLDTIVCMFSQYCSTPFEVEGVCIEYSDREGYITPVLRSRTEVIDVETCCSIIGVRLPAEEVASLLTKMCLKSAVEKDHKSVKVDVPPTRQDIIHPVDIYEDVAIAFGFNNIEMTTPATNCIGHQFELNKVTDQMREQVAQAGFTEALTFTLCSRDDVGCKLCKDVKLVSPVEVSNPKTSDFQVVRPSLLPGLLKTVGANRKLPLPLKIFEISDVVLKSNVTDEGAVNRRHLCALHYGLNTGFEVVHGLLDRVMVLLEIPSKDNEDVGYCLQATEDETYLSGRCADIVFGGNKIGRIGVLHPLVLVNNELNMPCSAFELDMEALI